MPVPRNRSFHPDVLRAQADSRREKARRGAGRPHHHSPRIFRSSSLKPSRCSRTSNDNALPGPEHCAACKGHSHPPARWRGRPGPRHPILSYPFHRIASYPLPFTPPHPTGRPRPSPGRRRSYSNRPRRQSGRGNGSPGIRGAGRGGVQRGPVAPASGRPGPGSRWPRPAGSPAPGPPRAAASWLWLRPLPARARRSPPAFTLIGRRPPRSR